MLDDWDSWTRLVLGNETARAAAEKVNLGEYGTLLNIIDEGKYFYTEPQKEYPTQSDPPSGKEPGLEKWEWHSEYTSQRALVLTQDSINQQFEALYQQDAAIRKIYHQGDGEFLKAELAGFRIELPPGLSCFDQQEIYLVIRIKTGEIKSRSSESGIDVTGFELAFPTKLASARCSVIGYSTQYLLRLLIDGISTGTPNAFFSRFGRDLTLEQWKRKDAKNDPNFVTMITFFNAMMDTNKKEGRTQLGLKIDYTGRNWAADRGATRLMHFNARKITNDSNYSDANYLLWLESPFCTASNNDVGSIFAKGLADKLKQSSTNAMVAERRPLRQDLFKEAMRQFASKLWFESDSHIHIYGPNLVQRQANFNWNVKFDWSGEPTEVTCARQLLVSGDDIQISLPAQSNGMPVNDWFNNNMKRRVYKRAKLEYTENVKVWVHGDDMLKMECKTRPSFQWSFYCWLDRVRWQDGAKSYLRMMVQAPTYLQASITRGNNDANITVEKQDVEINDQQGFRLDGQRDEAKGAMMRFRDRYNESSKQALEILKNYWKDQNFVDLVETKEWIKNSGIVLNADNEIKDTNRRVRWLFAKVDKFQPPNPNTIKIIGREEPKVETEKPKPPEPNANTNTNQPLNGATPEIVRAIQPKDVDLKSELRITSPEKIQPSSKVALSFDFLPKDTDPLRYRYVEIQFRAMKRRQQLFIQQGSDQVVAIDANVKFAVNKSYAAQQKALNSSIKSLRGLGYGVHLVGQQSETGTHPFTIAKNGEAEGLGVILTGTTNVAGKYDMVVAESLVDDHGDVLERREGSYVVTVAA